MAVNRQQERLKKFCGRTVRRPAAVFLAFGYVFAQSQGATAMLPRSSLAESQKSSLLAATEFF